MTRQIHLAGACRRLEVGPRSLPGSPLWGSPPASASRAGDSDPGVHAARRAHPATSRASGIAIAERL